MATTWGWRIPSVLQAFPSLFQIIFVYFLPESPRFRRRRRRQQDLLQNEQLTDTHRGAFAVSR